MKITSDKIAFGSKLLLFLCLFITIFIPNTSGMIILNTETRIKYGYDIGVLKPNSCKLVVCQCEICGIYLERKFRIAKLNKACLKCSNKINANKNLKERGAKVALWHSKNPHPLLGIPRPAHVIEALKMADRTYTSGKNNPFYGKIFHPKKSNYPYLIGEKKIFFRSSWELNTAIYLDNNKIVWEYEYKTFPVLMDGVIRHYTPDFYIDDGDYFIEVKGYWRLDANEKYTAFLLQNPKINIKIWDKQILKNLNII